VHGTLTHGKDSHAELHGHAHDDAVESALATLRTIGERVTSPRRAVIDVLAHSHDHVTAEQVSAAIGDGVHRATVYRTLDHLAELGIVSAMRSGDATGYHLAVTALGHEHLHARCRRCGRVVVLPVNSLQGAVDRLRHARLFRLDPAQSDLVGICETCASADR